MPAHKLTPTQFAILDNMAEGRNAFHGMPPGRSHAGGWDGAWSSLRRLGYIGGDRKISIAGAAALKLAKGEA